MRNAASILIVEDDRDLSAIMKRFLESENFDAFVATSAEDAYDMLAHASFQVIILDINLPGDDGIKLCHRLRRSSSTPVIFASARAGDDARALALEGGGDAYLSKPFSLRELLAQIKAVLKRTDANTSEKAEHGISLDTRKRQVYKDGKPIDLSPKEYELAAMLIRNAGQAIPKEQLLADVWGAFSDVEPQTLAVHMSWLRSKLEDDPAKPHFFNTVRGFGYCFDPCEDDVAKTESGSI